MTPQLALNLTDYPAFRSIIWKPVNEALGKKLMLSTGIL